MSSQVEIANYALTLVGEARIGSFDDDSEAARLLNVVWPIVRDAELRANAWNFATRRASLAALESVPAWGYAKQFALPDDFLRLIEVDGQYVAAPTDSPPAYQIEHGESGSVLLADLGAPLRIRYGARVDDTARFDPLFAVALGCALAAAINERISQSNTKQQLIYAQYKEALFRAQQADAIELPPQTLPESAWILARG